MIERLSNDENDSLATKHAKNGSTEPVNNASRATMPRKLDVGREENAKGPCCRMKWCVTDELVSGTWTIRGSRVRVVKPCY